VEALCKHKDISRAEAIEENCRRQGIRILCMQDAAYPDRLRNIDDPPLVIYVKGKLPPVDDRLCIGIVGTRKATDYGLSSAERIARELAERGCCIVTGLAAGIDSAAARGALAAHGTVIGVLGTGLDRVFPSGNEKLQEAVGRAGTLISEYTPGTGPTRYSFPQRNRIISGLCQGVVIVEAPEKSGALITAARAQEQGRDIFVVPGMVDDPGFRGSNALIRDGAQLVRSGRDVLEEYLFRYPQAVLPPRRKGTVFSPDATKEAIDKAEGVDYISLSEQLESLTEAELKAVGELARGPCFADELIRRSGLAASEAMAALTMLQLKGCVREEDGRYRLLVRPGAGG
jgi:DNA processing protein